MKEVEEGTLESEHHTALKFLPCSHEGKALGSLVLTSRTRPYSDPTPSRAHKAEICVISGSPICCPNYIHSPQISAPKEQNRGPCVLSEGPLL